MTYQRPTSDGLTPGQAAINAHYGRSDFGDAILEWLRAQGKNLDELAAADLNPLDQFHGGGLNATRELAELVTPSEATRVVDLGGGIGGSARYVAATYGCRVDVVDITAEFCRVGELLTKLTRLDDRITFHQRSATATGLPDASFDVAWLQNAAMNIEDRPSLYREIKRLLKPGGRLVLQEVFAGDDGPPTYPLPWASTERDSFLYSPEAVLDLFLSNGFRVLSWEDTTERDWGTPIPAGPAAPPPSFLPPEERRLVRDNGRAASAAGFLRSGLALLQRL